MSAPAGAECTATSQITGNAHLLPIRFGSVNRQKGLQSVKSLLASVYVSPANSGLPGDDILWTCDEEDQEQLHFLVATNGYHAHGGRTEIGARDGLKGVYATWFNNVGLKQSIGNTTLTQKWREVPLGPIPADPATGKLHIRVKDIPPLYAELYWVTQSTPGRSVGADTCKGIGNPSYDGTAYDCTAANSYLQLVGPGLVHDNDGEDSLSNRRGINAGNGFGYRMYNAATLRATASCVVRSPDQSVTFPPISASELMKGQTVRASFRIELECHSNANKGDNENNKTFFSLQASPGAFAAAQARGLVNGQGRVEYLLSDRTGSDPSLAQGVGITLRCRKNGSKKCYFSSPFNPRSQNSEEDGWYSAFTYASLIPPALDHTHWMLEFDAVLTRLPDEEDVKPGKVHATARITVKVP